MTQPIVLHSLTPGYVFLPLAVAGGIVIYFKALKLFREALVDPIPKERRDAFTLGLFTLALAIALSWVVVGIIRHQGVCEVTFHDGRIELRYQLTTVHVRDADCRSVQTQVVEGRRKTVKEVVLTTTQGRHEMWGLYNDEQERRQLEQVYAELTARIQRNAAQASEAK